jgi:glycosyltransferase involved in cell wall biosynthesis
MHSLAIEEHDDATTLARRARARSAFDVPPDAVVFGMFDTLAPDRRVPQILRAFSVVHAQVPAARLLLVGPADPAIETRALARALGIADVTLIHDELDALDHHGLTAEDLVAAADVTLALRWPPVRETPAIWLTAAAAGRTGILFDLVHLALVPMLDPRTWRRHAPSDGSAQGDAEAVAVGIDVLDEDHSLRLALPRLARDAGLRQRLGAAARGYWQSTRSHGAQAQ